MNRKLVFALSVVFLALAATTIALYTKKPDGPDTTVGKRFIAAADLVGNLYEIGDPVSAGEKATVRTLVRDVYCDIDLERNPSVKYGWIAKTIHCGKTKS